MENLECPQCGSVLANGVAVCGACGAEVKDDDRKEEPLSLPPAEPEKGQGKKGLYAVLALLLVILAGAALLVFTGLLPNPIKSGGGTAAIVNGEKISMAEVDEKFNLLQKMTGRDRQPDSATPEAQAAAADMRNQILNRLIQEKILVTEAAKEGITVSPSEVSDKINGIKKSLNLSDADFGAFLQQHGLNEAAFEKRVERDFVTERMMAKGTEKGLSRNAWLEELRKRANVEILTQ